LEVEALLSADNPVSMISSFLEECQADFGRYNFPLWLGTDSCNLARYSFVREKEACFDQVIKLPTGWPKGES